MESPYGEEDEYLFDINTCIATAKVLIQAPFADNRIVFNDEINDSLTSFLRVMFYNSKHLPQVVCVFQEYGLSLAILYLEDGTMVLVSIQCKNWLWNFVNPEAGYSDARLARYMAYAKWWRNQVTKHPKRISVLRAFNKVLFKLKVI